VQKTNKKSKIRCWSGSKQTWKRDYRGKEGQSIHSGFL